MKEEIYPDRPFTFSVTAVATETGKFKVRVLSSDLGLLLTAAEARELSYLLTKCFQRIESMERGEAST